MASWRPQGSIWRASGLDFKGFWGRFVTIFLCFLGSFLRRKRRAKGKFMLHVSRCRARCGRLPTATWIRAARKTFFSSFWHGTGRGGANERKCEAVFFSFRHGTGRGGANAFIISSYHHIIISSYHHIIIPSYHHLIVSAYHHMTRRKIHMPLFGEFS